MSTRLIFFKWLSLHDFFQQYLLLMFFRGEGSGDFSPPPPSPKKNGPSLKELRGIKCEGWALQEPAKTHENNVNQVHKVKNQVQKAKTRSFIIYFIITCGSFCEN